MNEVFEINLSIWSISHSSVGFLKQDGSDLRFLKTWVIARFQTGLALKQKASQNKISVEKLPLLEKSQLLGCSQNEMREYEFSEIKEDGSDEWVFGDDSLQHYDRSHPTSNSETVHVIIDKHDGSTETSPRNADLN